MHTGSVSASVSEYSNDNIPGGQETVRIPSRLTFELAYQLFAVKID